MVPGVWLVQHFDTSLSASSSKSEQQAAWDGLSRSSAALLDGGCLRGGLFLRNEHRSEVRGSYLDAISRSSNAPEDVEPLMLSVHHEPPTTMRRYALLNGLALLWASAMWLVVTFLVRVDPLLIQEQRDIRSEMSDQILQLLHATIPHGRLFSTRMLVWVCVAVFLLMIKDSVGFMTFRTQDLVKWGADYRPLTVDDEPWRIFSSMFLHGGVYHLMLNMVGLLIGGVFLEQVIGRWTFLSCYIICGVGGGLASLWYNPEVVSVGASGAIFGLYGMGISLAFLNRIRIEDMKFFALIAAVLIVFNLAMAMLDDNINNMAHIGGLVTGFLLGILLGLVGRFARTEIDL